MTTPSESTEHIEALVALETFRLYVRDWMSANAVIPDEIRAPVKGQPLSPEMKQWVVEFRRKLGAQGWIAPNWPRRYGGGGLPGAYASVVQKELAKQSIPPIYVSIMHAAALRTFGTEEQKTTLLKLLLQGEITMCHAFNERTHGSDISANTTEARKGRRRLHHHRHQGLHHQHPGPRRGAHPCCNQPGRAAQPANEHDLRGHGHRWRGDQAREPASGRSRAQVPVH